MQKVNLEDGQSANNVSENIERLKELFPEAFTENGVDFETLRQLLGDAKVLDESEEKFGLNWHGKKKARQIALTPSTGTLLPCPEESVNWDTTQNLFIEGDNLEVLKLLQKSYANKVKMIYIDPPYNTGKEFIYPDKFQDNLDTYLKYTGQVDDEGMKFSTNTETTGRKHTNWLSMMYPRLKIARSLLKDDGVIFISIDDTELANLKKIGDEIFGEENFLGTILWKKKTNGNNMGYIPPVHDYVLCFGKYASETSLLGFPLSQEYIDSNYSNPDNDPRGPWTTSDLSANHKGPHFPIENPNTGEIYYPAEGRYWVFNEATVKEKIADGRIIFGKSGKSAPVQKKFFAERDTQRLKAESWWSNHGLNSDGMEELGALLGKKKIFDHPKPSVFIKHLLNISTTNNDLILDFFAGTSPTAQATINLNHEDGKNRKFIMVQLPELCAAESVAYNEGYKTISDIGKKRILQVINQIKEQDADYIGDLGFKVFKLGSSNISAWNPDHTDLEGTLLSHEEHLIEGRTEQDVLYELLLKRGVDLAVPIESREVVGKNIYSIGYGVLFACLDESISREQVENIAQAIIDWQAELAPNSETHVFFRDSAFENDKAKTNMAAILEQNGITHVRSL
ncbi:MAG TPA: site-specific DNA-methyltransferase [Nitrosomonas nitrosa]|nr:site-specific DNA-methyltransferase [Nitrosomonas nitrosa]